MPKRFLPSLPATFYNWTSLIGALLASISFLLVILLLGITVFFESNPNPYEGIFLFMILPGVLIVGLILIPIGMLRTHLRHRANADEEHPRIPVLDFNRRHQRNAAIIFVFGTILLIFVAAVGSYQAYNYSESVEFCGTTCHQVMKPEYTAYQASPHARVPCASCHIGPGAGWFVRSKLSGAYQVYAVIANKYPRPIPTPIENLRPAQETCEQCHWPEKFFGAQQKVFHHTLYDETNTAWPIELLLKTGGGDPRTGTAHGIHWHMNIGASVRYVARDEKRQEIPWVEMTDKTTGEVRVYESASKPLTDEEKATLPKRRMDCMDCHNRPSHIFRSPDWAIDFSLFTKRIDRSLPEVKVAAVDAMQQEYETSDAAREGIAQKIADFYREKYPDVWKDRQDDVQKAIVAVQDAFATNIFPEMKTRWTEYPSNLGHFTSLGCMRCHNDDLKTKDGKSVTTTCTTCHTILSQGSGDEAEVSASAEGLEFKHPVDIGEAWKEGPCADCHTGVQP